MQGTRPADATGLPVKRRRSTKTDSVTLASVILASAAVAPVADAKAFHDRAGARKILGDAVERLLGVLDMIEGDPDLEETGDLEPSLGAYYGGSPDLELDPSDDEPSLGAFDRMLDQTKSYRQTVGWNRGEDCEQDDCDREDGGDTEPNGDEDDGPDPDYEPSLGAPEIDEDGGQIGWSKGGHLDLEEAPPVLAEYRNRVRPKYQGVAQCLYKITAR